ncbi:NCAIR mutase (PurE)-related protein [Caldalkalibacillus uzonensis]|uniref:NCAIR mutase (PurE)-related protein n=1 Tax=Caldalkalibacillus uzonensis TaxID=353224 RepID=A0ABU0CQ92_9BACI|nr:MULTISPECIES: nickel pincer cofactor biosynthesis protein LarB [Caldalkalibacillus]MDQ0338322.1 NCAIR mutase (PurE)-related protein [Caldalkalibacillus uzonensis]GGK32532.1 1-(5-phosphoribosyl)-5-amino-4-imidazole-carboxylate carboxylase [Caldalkalibacillus thermarum]
MPDQLKHLLHQVAAGDLSPEMAYEQLKSYEDLGFAKVDYHRVRRKGFPEVIFGSGKTADQIVELFKRLMTQHKIILATRVSKDKAAAVRQSLPELSYDHTARILYYADKPLEPRTKGAIGILCAGTADLPVAEEAALTALAMGNRVKRFYDVGVAGIHRLFHHLEQIKQCRVLIVIAGMEGALPSVVGGLVHQPVIAVPTSVGYGAHFNGLAPLLTMLNSCSSGVTVVNIDNGFGAAYSASLINQLGEE